MTISKWLEQIKSSKNTTQLFKDCGLYNDMFFYLKTQNINDIFDLILKEGFTLSLEQKQVSNFYKTDVVDKYSFFKKGLQINITVPNNGIVFSKGSYLGSLLKGNEIDFKYDVSIQFGIFKSPIYIKRLIINFCEQFIIKEKVQSFISTVNCDNPEFNKFSNYIN